LSVQCYAWTEYKFTCVCVCVCEGVCVCVSVTRQLAYRSDPSMDFYRRADLRKHVPFGGLDDE